MDALTKAGVNAGLSEPMAKLLALQTVYGSAYMAIESNESLEQLRKNVTSPGGTTEAALRVFMKDDVLDKLVNDAVSTAQKRSKELSQA